MIFIFIISCEKVNEITPKESIVKKDIIISSLEDYLDKHKVKMTKYNEEIYVGLTKENLDLLKQKFKKATTEEIENDSAYNKKALRLNKKYLDMKSFLETRENILLFSKHLGYSPNEIKDIVYKDKNAIVSFLRKEGSYESFLIFLDNNYIKIKLIDYLYS